MNKKIHETRFPRKPRLPKSSFLVFAYTNATTTSFHTGTNIAATHHIHPKTIDCFHDLHSFSFFPIDLVGMLSLYAISVNPFLPVVTVHARVPSNGICRGFAFKYGKFLLPPRFLTALSVPKVPPREQ